ncbi:methyl-accepting chemotaxis sensory transducer [Paenibacillus curdlanolyticus YK9]|uniref:Methyl-accepting chemotaxis sensory transducer n=1 Tax=Paenibacillus curdlanolyticus YK9 TaxID=717606 RepID=E0IEM0_9BACL|nr:methyl-accepting chemotaxis protein [Paenibacillus curdlanolyticus]EFM09108.1 methyl-accepting chemotaxis sensory transducer [Paenibacillus curdlanolyticus YK9]
MRLWRNMSLVWKSSLVVSVLIIVIVSVMTMESSMRWRKDYMSDMKEKGRLLSTQLAAESAEVQLAADRLYKGENDGKDPASVAMQRRLVAMAGQANVEHAYLLLPEVEKDAQGSTMTYLLSDNFTGTDGRLGDVYPITEHFERAIEQANKYGEALSDAYANKNGTYRTYLTPIVSSDGDRIAWFGIDYSESKMQQELNASLRGELLIAVGTEAAGILVIVLFLLRMLAPLKKLTKLSEQAAGGDLTVSAQVLSRNEIGRLSGSFNDMIASLNQLTKHVQALSSDVSGNANAVNANAGESSEQTRLVAEAVREVAEGSAQQLQSSQESQRAMTEMAIGIQRIAESSSVVSELAVETSDKAKDGGQLIEGTVVQMRAIESDLLETNAAMNELQEETARIREAMELISDVAAQTHLLALNASIEAARAGEQGRGFAVVAQEIRKLAERTGESSLQVSDMLGSIVLRTNSTAYAISRSLEEARHGSGVAAEAGQSFLSIADGIRTLVDQIQEVSASTEQMSAGSEQIAASLDELERIAERSSDHASSAADAAERQLSLMRKVEAASQSMKASAEELLMAVGTFKV